jgi:Flp pilus assembly protein TadG
MTRSWRRLVDRLRRAQEGVAMVEFAYATVVIVPLFLTGIELTNYAVTRMRVSQLALHVADNASRIGDVSLLTKPQVTEAQINDLFIGANLQSGGMNLATNGRIIISSVEPLADPNTNNKFKIHWQRCYGAKTWPSSYGTPTSTAAGVNSVGPTTPINKSVTAPDGGGVMFVELAYTYKPVFLSQTLFANLNMRETAAMVIRNDRDYAGNSGSGVYPVAGVTASSSSCG